MNWAMNDENPNFSMLCDYAEARSCETFQIPDYERSPGETMGEEDAKNKTKQTKQLEIGGVMMLKAGSQKAVPSR